MEASAEGVGLQFNAGRMTYEGKRVVADARKGLVRIVRSAEDSLLHIQWLDRTAPGAAPEEDQIVFPNEAVFEKVTQSSGRVYLLRFKQDDRKFFYWMQGPRAQDDEQLCAQVNEQLNRPWDEEDDVSISPDPSEPQLTPSAAPDSQPATAGAGGDAVQLFDLQRILSNLTQQGGAAGDSQLAALHKDTGPGFSDIFRPDVVLPLLEESVVEERLAPYLPEGMQTLEAIAELMPSPQFQQQLDAFTLAVRSGQIDLTQFGIDPSTFVYTVSGFLEAIEDQTPPISTCDKDDTEKDTDMAER